MNVRGHMVICVCVALMAIAAIASTREPLAPVYYSPREAGRYAGQTITVEGQASVYTAKNGVVFVDLGGSGQNSPVAGVIFKENAAIFPNIYRYDGKTVDMSGRVQKYKGKPQIILRKAAQLQLK